MLTELKAYSSWPSAPQLLLDDNGREETDLLQIRNIEGLGPVKSAVNTSPYGSVDGVAYLGTNVPFRNIVLTIGFNPDWIDHTYEELRRLVYLYFMPKKETRLVFFSDDISPVEISGIVESCEPNPFSKDPEATVSIICPDPYFTSLDPIVVTGESSDGSDPVEIQYNGSIEAGINVKVLHNTDPNPSTIYIQIGDPSVQFFHVTATVSLTSYFEVNSIPGSKYIRMVSTSSGVVTNILTKMASGSTWPLLLPGLNTFAVITNQPGHQDWTLTYSEKYGGI